MKIGIDPGLTGAIAGLSDELKFVFVVDMPTWTLGVKHSQVNAVAVGQILESWRRKYDGSLTVYMEQVNAMPGQGVTSMFNFGMSYGMIQGCCGALQIPMVLVRPNAWKKKCSLTGKPKDASRTLAGQYYPEAELNLKKHTGRADAILIARFGWLV
jgi:crossover junction endodeoxyribonuclease RuvC